MIFISYNIDSQNNQCFPEDSMHFIKLLHIIWNSASSMQWVCAKSRVLSSYRNITFWLILTLFFRELTEKEKMYDYLVQDSFMAHTLNLSMTVIEKLFNEWLISCGLWMWCFGYESLWLLFVRDTKRGCVWTIHILSKKWNTISGEKSIYILRALS